MDREPYNIKTHVPDLIRDLPQLSKEAPDQVRGAVRS